MTIGEVCTRSIVTAAPNDLVVDAARLMRNWHVGDLVVVDTDRRPIGILTDRDIVVSAVAQSPDELDTLLVGDIMTRGISTTPAAGTIDEALKTMRDRGIRRLPVVDDDGRLEGLIALDDILEVVSSELGALVSLVAREQKRERAVRT